MESIDVIKTMMESSGMSVRKLGTSLGKSEYYAKRILYGQKNVPSVILFSHIADVCGYELFVRKREDGTEISIDPK